MGRYKIKILPIAQDDMKSIIAYIRLDDPEAAIRMYDNIKSVIGRLADHPQIGAMPRDKRIAEQGYRMVIAEPYLVFYIVVVDDESVEIHRVVHGKHDYPNIM